MRDLRPRIALHEDAAFQARFPAQYGARVRVNLRGGSSFEAEVHDTYGDPARPMSQSAVQAKARALMSAAGWADSRIDEAVAVCAALPDAGDLRRLHAVMLMGRA